MTCHASDNRKNSKGEKEIFFKLIWMQINTSDVWRGGRRGVVVFIVCQVLSVFDKRRQGGWSLWHPDTCYWPLVVWRRGQYYLEGIDIFSRKNQKLSKITSVHHSSVPSRQHPSQPRHHYPRNCCHHRRCHQHFYRVPVIFSPGDTLTHVGGTSHVTRPGDSPHVIISMTHLSVIKCLTINTQKTRSIWGHFPFIEGIDKYIQHKVYYCIILETPDQRDHMYS